MTQQTINLYDGLEALYYMDSTYYDDTADEIKDKSGHGRHAQASGGPTIGVEGPDSFEATSFDGSDDQFDAGAPIGTTGDETLFALAKADGLDGAPAITGNTDGNNGTALFFDVSEDLRYTVAASNSTTAKFGGIQEDTWYALTGVVDSGNTRLYVNGSLEATGSYSGKLAGDDNFLIGNYPRFDSRFNGDIAVVGRWFRALSDAEIEYLNRLTAPRRAQL